MTEKDVKLV